MRAESKTAPPLIEFNKLSSGFVEINFYDNVKEVTKDEESFFEFDLYTAVLESRAGLEESIKANRQAWVDSLKQKELEPPEKTEIEKMEEKIEIMDGALNEMLFTILPEMQGVL